MDKWTTSTASAAKAVKPPSSENTLREDDESLDEDRCVRGEGNQEEPDDFDDLESELYGYERSDRDRREGDDRDLTEVAAPAPVDRTRTPGDSLEYQESDARRRESHGTEPDDGDGFLTELAAPAPIDRGQPQNDEEKGEGSFPPSLESQDDQEVKNRAC